jgi:subtilase family serine protease
LLTAVGAAIMAVTAGASAARAETTLPARLQTLDRGPTDASKVITISVHLNKPDEAGFQKTVAALYDHSSPTFHHWLTDADLQRFAPPAEQREAVITALKNAGLTVLGTDRNGFSVRARGTVGDVARAFNTEIHDFGRDGQVFRRNITAARLSGDANAYVKVVAGLESHTVHPMLTRQKNLITGATPKNVPIKLIKPDGIGKYVTDVILSAPQTYTYNTSGGLPSAAYTGVVYGNNPNLTPDFAPKQLEQAYGLFPAYKQGLTGAGQTVIVLEGFGYPTVEADANAAAKLNGLPKFTDSNFAIVYPEGPPADPNAGIVEGWNIEIALDVQSSHSIAPGANVLVVATAGQDGEDFQYSMQYIIDNNLGYAVSDSWEEDQDLFAGAAEQQSYEDILIMGAAKGVSFQFSTGDSGDGGLGTPLGAPGVPSVSPHATAVGGTAIVNGVGVGSKGFLPVGWGDGISYVAFDGPYAAPDPFFYAGGGGGESVYWPKPAWQASLPGTGRQTPDVSALADPFTGFPLVITEGTEQELAPGWGGTSLASPIFTAFWALAQQAAGGPLGQASPTLATLKTGPSAGFLDVVPRSSPNNVTGVLTTSSGTTNFSTADIFSGIIGGNTTFIGANWTEDGGEIGYGFGFALDSSLTVTTGWDNATGYGTPYGLAFINAVAASVSTTTTKK